MPCPDTPCTEYLPIEKGGFRDPCSVLQCIPQMDRVFWDAEVHQELDGLLLGVLFFADPCWVPLEPGAQYAPLRRKGTNRWGDHEKSCGQNHLFWVIILVGGSRSGPPWTPVV